MVTYQNQLKTNGDKIFVLIVGLKLLYDSILVTVKLGIFLCTIVYAFLLKWTTHTVFINIYVDIWVID